MEGVKVNAQIIGDTVNDDGLVQWISEALAYPNERRIELKLRLSEAAKLLITVQDNSGRQLVHKFLEFSAGEVLLDIPTTNLASGVYFTKIQLSNGDTYFRKFAVN